MSPTVRETAHRSPDFVAGALAVRPRPIHHEAAIGYLIRVSQANGFTTPRQLWHALLLSNAHPLTFDELMDVLGVIPEDRQFLLGPLPHYWKSPPVLGPGLAVNDYNHSVLRWCPSCIEESPYLRGVWGLKLNALVPDIAAYCPIAVPFAALHSDSSVPKLHGVLAEQD